MATKATNGHVVKSLAAVATFFDVSYGQVQKEWRRSGMPVESDGRYDLRKIRRWKEARQKDKPQTGSVTPVLEKRRSLEAEIKAEELRSKRRANELREGEYVARRDVDAFFAAFFTRLRDDLARIPLEMRHTFPKDLAGELERQLKARHDMLLTTLYNQRSKIGVIDQQTGETRGRPRK